MIIRRRRGSAPRPSELTPEALFQQRRRFIGQGPLAAVGAAALGPGLAVAKPMAELAALDALEPGPYSTGDPPTSYQSITSYNNFYEFGTDKADPALLAPELLQTEPWTVQVSGEAEVTGPVAFEDLIRPHRLQERIYRLRCVEAWSMVVPWVGVPLGEVIRRFRPTSRARYVKFVTLFDPAQMPAACANSPWRNSATARHCGSAKRPAAAA